MFLSTLGEPPPGYKIKEALSMIQKTKPIEVSGKGVIRTLMERNRNEFQEAYDEFAAAAPPGANAILGIQVTSAALPGSDISLLYLTYAGTAVVLEKED